MSKIDLIPDSACSHDNVFDVLKERGFIKQTTHEDEIRDLLGKESVTFYIGFDPTADSLHVGHFMQMIIMMWMQRYGHRPIALIGGGTAMIGDPSGRSDMRLLMTRELIAANGVKFEKLFGDFIDFGEGGAILDDNSNWLLPLNYIEFIRDYGKHFSVNNMLRAECYKNRLEAGLSFLEFNYMLLQSYDFLELYKRYNCKMQFGGDDQWSNIISGVDLIRRELTEQAYGMTFTLLETSEGVKMGKTQKGALWLDATKTSPYEFFQYWRNVADADVGTCLRLLTFLPMERVRELEAYRDAEINRAKEILAYEITSLVHGEAEADKALESARALFGGGGDMEDVPTYELDRAELTGDGDSSSDGTGTGIGIVNLIREAGLVASNAEGFRAIQQGGLTIDDRPVSDPKLFLKEADFPGGQILIRRGKKKYCRVVLK